MGRIRQESCCRSKNLVYFVCPRLVLLPFPTQNAGFLYNFDCWICKHTLGKLFHPLRIRLGSIWGSGIVPYNSDQYYQLSTENWRGIICTFPQFYLCSFLLWTLNYLESQISLLGEMVSLCLDTPSMYVLEIISRVGAIVELTLLAPHSPHARNPFSAARCLM